VTDDLAAPGAQGKIDSVDLTPYLNPPSLVLVISGPSGVGKDATVKRMIELGYPCGFVVTATNRSPREGEVHGVDYYFVSTAEFKRMIRDGELLEYAVVYDEYKGVPKAEITNALASRQDVVLRVDVQGAARLRQVMPGAVSIFLTAPSEQELIRRLQARHTEVGEALQCRIAMARAEMRELGKFDYVVFNREGQLDRTVERILAIIAAEKSRTVQRKVTL